MTVIMHINLYADKLLCNMKVGRLGKMKISKEEVLHVANLAHLTLNDDEIDKFAGQIGTILDYFDLLKKVDATGVKPTSHAIFLTNAFREDELSEHLYREKAMANAPEREAGSFLVPKVIG